MIRTSWRMIRRTGNVIRRPGHMIGPSGIVRFSSHLWILSGLADVGLAWWLVELTSGTPGSEPQALLSFTVGVSRLRVSDEQSTLTLSEIQ